METWQVYGMDGELLAEYAASVAPASPQKEYGYRNGQLLITADAPAAVTNSATFVTTDTTTQGNWKGAYGVDGYNIINDGVSYPAYAQVSVTGQGSYTWAAATSETRAPLKAGSTADRLAACWYSGTNFTIEVNLSDGNSHRVAIYALDWDGNNGRTGTIEVLDAGTNAVLDTRALNSYSNGKYFVWELRGQVKIRLTHISPGGWNQVISGLFFDPVSVGSAKINPIGATASDYYGAGYEPSQGSDGNATTMWNAGGFAPQWLQLDLGQATNISKVRLLTAQYPPGQTTQQVYGGQTPDNLILLGTLEGTTASGQWLELNTTSTGIRYVKVLTTNSPSWVAWSEIEVYGSSGGGSSSAAQIQWLVTDQLGTPRMIFDKTGSLATTKRHDYLPFGEELTSNQGARTPTLGYTAADGVRQKFTQKERDTETGLDYFGARYYSSTQGRFTSIDPENYQAMQDPSDPQSWNAYTYVNNNPLSRTDPDGRGFWEKLKNAFNGYGWRSNEEVQQLEDKWRNWLQEQEKEAGGALVNCDGGCTPGGPGQRLNIDSLSRNEVFHYAASLKQSIENGTVQHFSRDQIDKMSGITAPVITATGSGPNTVGQNLKNVRDIESGRLKGFSRGNTELSGGGQAAKETFKQLTGRDPAGSFDRVVQGTREVVYRASSRSGVAKIDIVDKAQKFVEKISFKP